MEQIWQFSTALEISTNKLWGAHLPIPDAIAQTLLQNDAKRVVCTLQSKIEYQCALIALGEGRYAVTVNKSYRDKLGLKEGSIVQVAIRKDDSEYGLPMSEELQAVLEQDEAGNRLFHALTPGKIRTLLYLVNQAKNSDLRIFRALTVIEHLKKNHGEIDYKGLHQEIRPRG